MCGGQNGALAEQRRTTMKQRSVMALFAVLAMAAIPLACKKDKPPENPQPFAPTGDAGVYPTGTQPTTPPPTTTTPPPPTATTTTATPGATDPAVEQVLATAMTPLAQKHAPGMRKEGEMMRGVLQEGQTIEQLAMLQPGKCYTVVGIGLPMIQELDINMVVQAPIPGAPSLPMAQDMMTGAEAALAPQPNCYKYALPLPAQVKIIVKATRGSGAVAAQIYVK